MRYLRGLGLAVALAMAGCANDPLGMATCGEAGLINADIQIINAIHPLPANFMASEAQVVGIIQSLCLLPTTNASAISANTSTLRGMRAQVSAAPVAPVTSGIPVKAKPLL